MAYLSRDRLLDLLVVLEERVEVEEILSVLGFGDRVFAMLEYASKLGKESSTSSCQLSRRPIVTEMC